MRLEWSLRAARDLEREYEYAAKHGNPQNAATVCGNSIPHRSMATHKLPRRSSVLIEVTGVKLIDPVVGELRYTDGWIRHDQVQFLGEMVSICVVFSGDADRQLDRVQREAFARFWADRDELIRVAELQMLRHYQSLRDDVAQRTADDAQVKPPAIALGVVDLRPLVELKEIYFPEDFGAGTRVVGLLAECEWDQSRGLAVRIENETVLEVGPQDIVH